MKLLIKTYFTFNIFLCITNTLSSQTLDWTWAQSHGGISNEYSNAICTDQNGNVYVTGTFQGPTFTIGGFTLHNYGTGSLDIFIAKFDASGNLLWLKGAGGPKDDWAYGICTDANGNIYITGFFQSPLIAFDTTILNNSDTTGSTDILITKYDSTGNIVWAKQEGSGQSYDHSYGICIDVNGNIYITGSYGYNTFTIMGHDTLNTHGSYDIFISKYDGNGNLIWAEGMGGNQSDEAHGICIDINSNIYVTGFFQTTAFFDNDSILCHGNTSVYVAKYNSSGHELWVKSAIGTSYDWNSGQGISSDALGNIYITGYFQNSIIFGPDTLGDNGTWSIFTAKYDSNGNALWGRCPGGTDYDYGNSICTDASGNIFVTGYYKSSYLNFGGSPLLNSNIGYEDIFLVEYDFNGNTLLAKSIGGQDADFGMSVTSSGNDVYLTGYLGSYSLNFGSNTITNNGSNDIFLAKLSTAVGIDERLLENRMIVYPNPTSDIIQIRTSNFSSGNIYLKDIQGKILLTEKLSEGKMDLTVPAELSMGIYFVQIISNRVNEVKKIVLLR
jgi:hypothetical protein